MTEQNRINKFAGELTPEAVARHFCRTDVQWKPAAQINAGDFILIYKDDNAEEAEPVRVLNARATPHHRMELRVDLPGRSTASLHMGTAVALPSEEWKSLPEQLLPGDLE